VQLRIDPAVYDTSPIRNDWEMVSGLQDAARSVVVQPKTATEAAISDQSLAARVAEFRDQVEDWLTEIAQYASELCLLAMTPQQVETIMGSPAQPDPQAAIAAAMNGQPVEPPAKTYEWPAQRTPETVFNLVQIKIRAGSTAAPNKLQAQDNWNKALQLLMPMVDKIRQIEAAGGGCDAGARAGEGDRCALRRDDRRRPLPAAEAAAQAGAAACASWHARTRLAGRRSARNARTARPRPRSRDAAHGRRRSAAAAVTLSLNPGATLMLVSRLLRTLLRFLSPGIVPDGVGGAADPAPAPAVDNAPAPAPAEPSASPAPAPDAFSALRSSLEALGEKSTAAPAPAPAAEPAPAPAPGQPRDPLGRFGTAAQKAAGVAAAPAPAPAPAPTAAPVAPKPGEIDLTPPEGMNERSQQRWAQLTERVKQVPDLERRATEASQALDSVRQMVTETGLAPDEFSDLLQTARLVKSTNPQDAQQALQRLDAIRADLAQRFGIDAPGVDPLSAHPDLKADVDGLLMTRERALEIARLRSGNQQSQATLNEQREMQQFRQTVQNAATSMERTMKAREGTPGHEAKVAYIANHFKSQQNLQAFVTTYRPEQWEGVLSMMYDAYNPQMAAPAMAPAAPVQQPLRPSSVRPGPGRLSRPVSMHGAQPRRKHERRHQRRRSRTEARRPVHAWKVR
jgi:hypothetical protein